MTENKEINVVFNKEPGKLFDFFMVIINGYQNNKLPNQDILLKRGLTPDPLVEKSFIHIWDSLSLDTPGLGLFFSSKETLMCFINSQYLEILYELNDIDSFIKDFTSRDFKIELLGYYDQIVKSDDEYKEIINDNSKLMELINSFDIDIKIKWELISYCTKEEIIKNELIAFFRIIQERIEQVHASNHELHRSFETRFHEKNQNSRDEFILFKENPGINRFVKKTVYDYTLSVSLLHEAVVFRFGLGRFVLGINYERLLKGNDSGYKSLSLYDDIKVLSDINRIKMLMMLKDNEITAGEISEKLGLANSTTSYHLDLLFQRKLLIRKKEGKNISYTANQENIRKLIEDIKDTIL